MHYESFFTILIPNRSYLINKRSRVYIFLQITDTCFYKLQLELKLQFSGLNDRPMYFLTVGSQIQIYIAKPSNWMHLTCARKRTLCAKSSQDIIILRRRRNFVNN